MTCQVNGNTNGLCPQYSFNQATNQISTPGFSYDAAGHLTQDGSTNPANTYQYDAEGRLSAILQNGTTFETMVYNARGQVVESDYPGFNAKVNGVFDPSGRELGYYDGAGGYWWDRDIWAAGRMVAQSFPSDSYCLHANALGSDTQVTDYSGAVQTDFIYYPWQNWTQTPNVVDAHFAGFEQSEGPNYVPFATSNPSLYDFTGLDLRVGFGEHAYCLPRGGTAPVRGSNAAGTWLPRKELHPQS